MVLGIELDSVAQVARLPTDKLLVLQELIQSWYMYGCHWCSRHQMESLNDHLHHAAIVVWPGRTFLCRMLDLLHNIPLIADFHLDLQW